MKLFCLSDVLVESKPSLDWVPLFIKDERFNDYRFKIFSPNGTVTFAFDFISEWIDIVTDIEEFNSFEIRRIPLFIGTQFGVYPKVFEEDRILHTPIVGILFKSILSGHVSGLSIYSVNLNKKGGEAFNDRNRLVRFGT